MINDKEKPLRREKSDAAVFVTDLRLRYDVVESLHQAVDVDAVGQRALLDVLEMRGGASDAAHAGIHEDFDGVGIFLDNLHDAHILCNRHANNLLCEM